MIGVTHQGKIAVLTLAHGKANTLDTEFCRAITGEFARLKKSPARSRRHHRGRADLLGRRQSDPRQPGRPKYLRTFLPALNKMYDAIFNFPKPVVAAVNGHAIAGGCVLSSLRRLPDDGAWQRPHRCHRASGRPAVSGAGVRGHALRHRARGISPRLIYTGNTYRAGRRAASAVCCTRWSSRQTLQERALASARMLADLSPAAFSQTKAQMRLAGHRAHQARRQEDRRGRHQDLDLAESDRRRSAPMWRRR